jgi:hypothetical protein
MNTQPEPDPLVRIAARRPKEVCATLQIDEYSRALLEADPSPSRFLTALIERAYSADAVAYLAHALPKADAVSWACQCVRMVLGDQPPIVAVKALAAAETWAREPGADSSRAAGAAAVESPNDRGARLAALAAFWSGASLVPADLPPVPPPAGLTGAGVAGAVTLAATSGDPASIPQRYREFLARGILIARTP